MMLRRNRAGFTLLEVMIAVGIIATTLVALLSLRNRDIQIQALTRDLTQATLLARNLMFDVSQDPDLVVGQIEGDFDHFPEYSWQKTVNTYLGIPRVWEVEVAVTWDDGREHLTMTRFVEART